MEEGLGVRVRDEDGGRGDEVVGREESEEVVGWEGEVWIGWLPPPPPLCFGRHFVAVGGDVLGARFHFGRPAAVVTPFRHAL